MKSVGEAMAIGRTFKEALQKAMRSLETGHLGFESLPSGDPSEPAAAGRTIAETLRKPTPRLWYIAEALRDGWTVEKIAQSPHRPLVSGEYPANCRLRR